MMSSPALGSPAYNNESIGWELMTTDFVTIIIACFLVIGRLYTKYFITKLPGWEDCCSVLALLIAIARVVGDSLGVYRYYMGRHFTSLPEWAFNPLVILVAVDGLLYTVAITLAKFAILIFLYRIFKVSKPFRYTAWAVGAIMGLWALITVLLVCFSCRPLGAAFNFKLRFAPTTVCKPQPYDVENIFGFCNILIDIMLLLMPMPLLWTLHMTRAKKIGVSVIFANGAVIAAMAIVRQYKLYTAPTTDPSWEIVHIKIWMVVEVNLAIICGCLPVLQPLFRTIPLLPSHIRSKLSPGPSAAEQRSWPLQLSGPHRRSPPDVERADARKAPWREPDELSDSGTSVQSLYHQRPVVRSALEPCAVRGGAVGSRERLAGVAM